MKMSVVDDDVHTQKDFLRKKHIKFFMRCLNVLPSSYSSLDTTRYKPHHIVTCFLFLFLKLSSELSISQFEVIFEALKAFQSFHEQSNRLLDKLKMHHTIYFHSQAHCGIFCLIWFGRAECAK